MGLRKKQLNNLIKDVKPQQKYLKSMGIETWQLRTAASGYTPEAKSVPSSVSNATDETKSLFSQDQSSWQALKEKVSACTCCALSASRTNVVFGVGNECAEVMLIGEAPGENEDLQGEPFVGRAGMLLNEMLRAINLKREEVYIANILKCRPPRNRDPSTEEVQLCTPFLTEQIALIRPKVLIAVGRIAAHFLLNTDVAMAKMRGRVYTYGELNTPLFVIYHPAYLLRSPSEKSKAYTDLKKIQEFLLG